MGTNNDFEIRHVLPAQIKPDPDQPRRHFDVDKLAELADSIAEQGLQQPPVCRMVDGELELIFGERRWRAGKLIATGYHSASLGGYRAAQKDFTMAVFVRDVDDHGALKLQLIENLQREEMTPMEEARAYQRLMDVFGESQVSASESLGVSRRRIQRRVGLMRLPESWQSRVDEGATPLWVVEAALAVPPDATSATAGKTALEDALQVASEARSAEAARMLLERRYVRPYRERVVWDSEDYEDRRDEGARQFADDYFEEEILPHEMEVMNWEQSRLLFPFDVVDLLPMNSRDFVMANEIPGPLDGLAPGRSANGCWGDLAIRYGAPLFIAADGKMGIAVVAKRALVREAAMMAASGPEDCLFLMDDAAGQQTQQEVAKAQRRVDDTDAAERSERGRAMLVALDASIRAGKRGPSELFFEAACMLLQMAVLGIQGKDHPMVLVLSVFDIELGEPIVFSGWPGLFDSEGYRVMEPPAVESLMVCAYVLLMLDRWDGELEACPEWIEVSEFYGVPPQN